MEGNMFNGDNPFRLNNSYFFVCFFYGGAFVLTIISLKVRARKELDKKKARVV